MRRPPRAGIRMSDNADSTRRGMLYLSCVTTAMSL